MKPELLEDVYMVGLQLALKGEELVAETVPEMTENAPPEIAEAFHRHGKETREQIRKLQQCLKRFETKGERIPEAMIMTAAIREMRELLKDGPDPELAAVIIGGAARKIEHLEIACYADLISMAQALHLNDDVRALSEILKEEQRMEQQLAGFGENALEEAASLAETVT